MSCRQFADSCIKCLLNGLSFFDFFAKCLIEFGHGSVLVLNLLVNIVFIGNRFRGMLKDTLDFKELEANAVEYQVIREIINARKELNLTQEQLAQLVGTKQSNISRLESGEYNPTLEFLGKVAQVMGKTLEVRLH